MWETRAYRGRWRLREGAKHGKCDPNWSLAFDSTDVTSKSSLDPPLSPPDGELPKNCSWAPAPRAREPRSCFWQVLITQRAFGCGEEPGLEHPLRRSTGLLM